MTSTVSVAGILLKLQELLLWVFPPLGLPELSAQGVSVIVDPADPIAGHAPSKWALKELEGALL